MSKNVRESIKVDYIAEKNEAIILSKKQQRIIYSSKESYELLKKYWKKEQEHFIVICLNTRNALIKFKAITIGTVDSSIFHPREVFKFAIKCNSSKIIVAHNHPSGNLEASQNDILMTSKIRNAAEIMGMPLVDSLIISEEGSRSII